jgi:hypothetical protein
MSVGRIGTRVYSLRLTTLQACRNTLLWKLFYMACSCSCSCMSCAHNIHRMIHRQDQVSSRETGSNENARWQTVTVTAFWAPQRGRVRLCSCPVSRMMLAGRGKAPPPRTRPACAQVERPRGGRCGTTSASASAVVSTLLKYMQFAHWHRTLACRVRVLRRRTVSRHSRPPLGSLS